MRQPLELYATDEAVARLEANLATTHGLERLEVLVSVAWHMRQRDTHRALALVEEAQSDLPAATEQRRWQARLMLVRGEVELLFGDLAASAKLARQALQDFEACADAIGSADAHWLQFSIALGHGDSTQADAELFAVAQHAHNGPDPVRVTMAHAALTTRDVYRDATAASQRWGAQFASGMADMHPAAATWVDGFFTALASQSSNHVEAVRRHSTAYAHAVATGQIPLSVMNISSNMPTNRSANVY